MKGSEESWQERVAAVAQIVRRGLPQFIGFELFLRVIALAIFTPLTAWLSARLIAWSGDGAISKDDRRGRGKWRHRMGGQNDSESQADDAASDENNSDDAAPATGNN